MDLTQVSVTLPFSDFKWRWMEVTPVESFNRADVLLGVTRAIGICTGTAASDPSFISELKKIQNDLFPGGTPNLVPSDRSRNVIRRQGRYWRGLGLLLPTSDNTLALTPFGQQYADGFITNADFVSSVVQNHVLPNPRIESGSVIQQWSDHKLQVHPLNLIIRLIISLISIDSRHAYITPNELCRVVIPLSARSGDFDVDDYAKLIVQYRSDNSAANHLPNCTPSANDRRMVREHLLFLHYFDVLEKSPQQTGDRFNEIYSINFDDIEKLQELLDIRIDDIAAEELPSYPNPIRAITYDPTNTRERRIAEITLRPNQAKFRKIILQNTGSRCLITGETILDVLDACHIHGVGKDGSDDPSNGICLRKDLHTLFDRGKLRIDEVGNIRLSSDLRSSATYRSLPQRIELPNYIDKEALRRRFVYGE